jgi:hypothetical protein
MTLFWILLYLVAGFPMMSLAADLVVDIEDYYLWTVIVWPIILGIAILIRIYDWATRRNHRWTIGTMKQFWRRL